MLCPCTLLGFQRYLVTYLKEGVLIADPNLYAWRFMFLKAFLSGRKKSESLRILSLNILQESTKEKHSIVSTVHTSLRVLLKMKMNKQIAQDVKHEI